MAEESNNQDTSLDPATIKLWIANQSHEIQNQKGEQEIRLKEIESTTRLSELSISIQRDLLTKQPSEFRKSLSLIVGLGMATLIIILLFLAYLICNGQREFAYKFCQGIGYLATTAMGYFFGKRSTSKKIANSEGTEQGFQDVH